MSTYRAETVIEEVGWLRTKEKLAIRQILGHGTSIYLDEFTQQLHLAWNVDADSIEEGIDTVRTLHFTARQATGVYVPRTTLFAVREIDQE